MSNDTPTLHATIRERKGTRYARRLRSEGRLPAVIYGHGSDPLSISLDHIETLRHLKAGSHVFEVDVEDQKGTETCLVKDLQFGWLGDDLIHLDLTRVDLDQLVEVKVRLHFVGEPPMLGTTTGGVLEYDLNEIEVSCKVREIPEEVTVRLENMAGDTLTIGDLEIPGGVTPTAESSERVCQIVVQDDTEAEETGEAGGEAAAEGEAPAETTEEAGDS